MTSDTTITRQFDFEIQETRSDGLELEGYAAVFNSPTRIQSWEGDFTEEIDRGAFTDSIANRTPVLQFDHGHHPLIGGLPIGRIRSLKEDAHGLGVRARLSDNWLIHPVRDAIRDGAITGMSFRFTVKEDKWKGDHRTIRKVDLHELGPVVFPAYKDTTVGVRSNDPIARLLADDSVLERLAQFLTFGKPDTSNAEPVEELDEVGVNPNLEAARNRLARLHYILEKQA